MNRALNQAAQAHGTASTALLVPSVVAALLVLPAEVAALAV